MMANAEPLAPVLKSRRQIYRTHDVLKQYEDQILNEYGLTVEKLGVLTVIGHLGGSARITDIGEWIDRSSNSVSMLVERMVKAGLVKRKRDRSDRREVYVSATSKGEAALKPAYSAMIEFVRKIFQPLSQADMNAICGLLGTLKYEILKSSNPKLDIKEVERTDSRKLADEERWLNESGLLSIPKAKGPSKTRPKTTRRTR
jgi:DNA-binding MarR family transcriptional regulator